MNPVAVLVTQPAVDFRTLINVASEALGYSISQASDSSGRKQHDAERLISMLAAMKDPKAKAGFTPHFLNQVSFSVLLAAHELDLLEILECAAGMPFTAVETQFRGVNLGYVHGTLEQWRGAVVTGTRRTGAVQFLYCRIMDQFEAVNLNVWTDFNKKPTGSNGVFLLEDKRK